MRIFIHLRDVLYAARERCVSAMGRVGNDDYGNAQVEFLGWFIGLGLPLLYFIFTIASVQATAFGVQSAAAAAARVLSVDSSHQSPQHAAQAAQVNLRDQHISEDLIDRGINIGCVDAGCSRYGVDIHIPVALPFTHGVIDLPFVAVDAHRDVIRSGQEGRR